MIREFKKEWFKTKVQKEWPIDGPLLSLKSNAVIETVSKGIGYNPYNNTSLYHALLAKAEYIDGVCIDGMSNDDVSETIWKLGGGNDTEAVITLDGFKNIYAAKLSCICKYFEYIWLPLTDDLLVISCDASLVMFIDHDGYIATCKLDTQMR